MPRGKVRIQYIENDTKRKTTLKKRLNSLIKKVNELSILCRVMALLVVYRPDEEQAVVWPSMTEALAIAEEYTSINSDKLKNALDGQGFLQQQVDKERGKLQNLQRTAETKRCLHDICIRRDSLKLQGLTLTPEVVGEVRNGLNLQVITEVQCKLQSTLRAVSDRLKDIRSGSTSSAPQQQGMLPPAELEAPLAPIPQPQEVEMADDFFVAPPAGTDVVPPPPPMPPMETDPPHADDAPMTSLGGLIFHVLNGYDVAGDGSDILAPEELRVMLVRAGINPPPPPNV